MKKQTLCFYAMTLMLLSTSISVIAQPKQLKLHFDVNKTIIAMDLVQGKEVPETVNAILAEFTFAKWNGRDQESYRDYITNKLAKANPTLSRKSEEFKKARAEELKKFPTYLRNNHPGLFAQFSEDRTRMNTILLPKGDNPMVVFPSFFKAIRWLQKNYPDNFTLTLRTFGQDLPEIVPMIEKIAKIKFAGIGEFKGRDLTLEVPEKLVPTFLSGSNMKNYAIRDDYKYWKSQGFKASGGKPFPLDRSDSDSAYIFFDDNADDPDKPIVNPFGPNNEPLDTKEMMREGYIVAVNPKEAILDDNYFINKIKAFLRKRGKR